MLQQVKDFFNPKSKTPPPEPVRPGLAHQNNIIAVSSAKGGVGKSTTAIMLARALSIKGYKVGVLDADIYGPSLPTMAPLDSPPQTIEDPLADTQIKENQTPQPALFSPGKSGPLSVLSIDYFNPETKAHIMRGPMAANVLKQLITQCVWGKLDFLIIDYPPGTGDIQITLSQLIPITAAVLVTSPQEVSLKDTRRAAQMFQTLKVPVIGYVETYSWFECDDCHKKHELYPRAPNDQTLERHHDLSCLGQIPFDPKLARACDLGLVLKDDISSFSSTACYENVALSFLHELKDLKQVATAAPILESFELDWQ